MSKRTKYSGERPVIYFDMKKKARQMIAPQLQQTPKAKPRSSNYRKATFRHYHLHET
jgi:hypothetical protein